MKKIIFIILPTLKFSEKVLGSFLFLMFKHTQKQKAPSKGKNNPGEQFDFNTVLKETERKYIYFSFNA